MYKIIVIYIETQSLYNHNSYETNIYNPIVVSEHMVRSD